MKCILLSLLLSFGALAAESRPIIYSENSACGAVDVQLAQARIRIRELLAALETETTQKHRYIRAQIETQRKLIKLLSQG